MRYVIMCQSGVWYVLDTQNHGAIVFEASRKGECLDWIASNK